jgi:hypothetical protein
VSVTTHARTIHELGAFAQRRLARRPDLGSLDPDDLAEPALLVARIVWTRRVVNERASVELARRLRALGQAAASDLRALDAELAAAIDSALARFEDDEAAHAELVTAVLERLGGSVPPVREALRPRPLAAPTITFVREVLTGMAICETVSAARYAAVHRATDLSTPRACIDLMLRDEVAHARLGFTLLPVAIAAARRIADDAVVDEVIAEELVATFRELDLVVGMDSDRRGQRPTARRQPSNNPGIVEPASDAVAFYAAIESRIVPRLEAIGVAAEQAWRERWR